MVRSLPGERLRVIGLKDEPFLLLGDYSESFPHFWSLPAHF
jgi:hypothetical protein